MEIREAVEGDAGQLLELFKTLDCETNFMLFDEGERRCSETTQKALISQISAANHRILLVVEEQSGLIGFLGATGGQFNRTRHVVDFAMGVVQAHWRNGVASQLLTKFELWATAQKFHRIEMTVMQENLPARKLYEKYGYQQEGVRRASMNVNGQFCNELYMSKLLT